MPLLDNTFVKGADLVPSLEGFATILEQCTEQAVPSATYGIILYDSSTPVITGVYAWRTRCLWLDTTITAAPVLKAYRTTGSPGWFPVADAISNNTITTAMLQDLSVTIGKLSVTGNTAAGQLIRVNAGRTGFEFVNASTIVSGFGAIAITSLDNTGVGITDELFVGCIGNTAGEIYWRAADDIAGLFGNAAVAPEAIAPATVLTSTTKFLSSRTGDTYGVYRVIDPDTDIADGGINGDKLTDESIVGDKLSDASVPVSKLSAGTNGYIPSTVAGSVVWVAPSAITGVLAKFVSTVGAGPGYAPLVPTAILSPVVIAHTLAGVPQSVRVVMYCNTANLGYVSGDEVDINSATWASGSDQLAAYPVSVDATNVTIRLVVAGSVFIPAKATGVWTAITPGSWSLKIYCLYLA